MIESPLIQELLTQAEQRVRRADILRALKLRFQCVPPDLIAAVEIVTDDNRLDELLDLATLCPDVSAFRARSSL